MTIEPKDYLPTFNNWFMTNIAYTGIGRAEFLNPNGWVEGPVEIRFNEVGDTTVQLLIERYELDDAAKTGDRLYDVMWMLEGRKPHKSGTTTTFYSGLQPSNTCVSFVVVSETEGWTFSALDEIYYDCLGTVLHSTITIRFHVSRFDAFTLAKPKYWVFPLINFLTEVGVRSPQNRLTFLDKHPLRIRCIPDLPNEIVDNEVSELIWLINNHGNRYIAFQYEDAWGFIEPLSDFDDRKKKLHEHGKHKLVTSVMVGEIGNHSTEWENILDWIPMDFIQLLSLATGSLVGIPWIEFRDDKGELVSRIHIQEWQFPYLKGHEAIPGRVGGGIGLLLSQAPNPLPSDIRNAIQLTVMGGFKDFHIEERKTFFFRALDVLSKKYRQTKKVSMLNDQLVEEIREILIDTKDKLLKKRRKSDPDEIRTEIERLANRVVSAVDPSTVGDAEAILLFLDELGLNDPEVIRKSISEKEWVRRYKKYRTQVIHGGHLHIGEEPSEVEEIVNFSEHLHDILLRVILKSVTYSGEYSKVIRIREDVSVDWVKVDTPAQKLGYK